MFICVIEGQMVGGGVGKWLGDAKMICFKKQVRALGCFLLPIRQRHLFLFSGEGKQVSHPSFSMCLSGI